MDEDVDGASRAASPMTSMATGPQPLPTTSTYSIPLGKMGRRKETPPTADVLRGEPKVLVAREGKTK